MAIFHVATNTPTKAEVIATWIPTQAWGPTAADAIETIGSFHFDDPDGRVGMETHLIAAGGTLMQVPLTYRDAPLHGAEEALIATIEHSVLGTRWVYDATRDDQFLLVLAGVALTGQGESLGWASHEGRRYIAPSAVRIHGGGWTQTPVPVDGFHPIADNTTNLVVRNDRFELTFFRHPRAAPQPAIGLTATCDEHPEPVVLAEVCEHRPRR